ncbi:uncharacterized protein TRAVEDRAFT_26247 [Trametes versicolor FP-101664 SS1]|uniref:uncharacterized protein n=1 Tax=Trametes versicolor (strain FP-101664) TaxID=717944 RepID=UPI0004622C40|nr:uncharacterized protein TRAVEDRAFT_26247 [Trametes versicolor FP-101664 SS1]EIW62535.1 hypothetical protein TRAVEDRAFT_26247 [Trametes versicolor FP-101664 SS1]
MSRQHERSGPPLSANRGTTSRAAAKDAGSREALACHSRGVPSAASGPPRLMPATYWPLPTTSARRARRGLPLRSPSRGREGARSWGIF